MDSQNIKEWSILIYANGNNELEPEISNSKKIAETIGSDKNVNVVMQIARESKELVKILRPYDTFAKDNDEWTGTRRYFIEKNNSKLISKLDNIIMSDAKNLYDFIVWAVENYPAKHYMLILGGHGYQFVGCMTDYSGTLPYIMGFPEMSNAIHLACEKLDIDIDYLFLDTCYSNFIEVAYEFGKNQNHSVKFLITYIIDGPLIGFPLDEIIKIIEGNYDINQTPAILNLIIKSMKDNVIAFKIDYDVLSDIKQLFSDLAGIYNNLNDKDKIGLPQLFDIQNSNMPYGKVVNSIISKMNSLIYGYKTSPNNKYPLVNVANNPAKDIYVIRLYNRLAFSKNNNWAKLLYSSANILNSNNTDLDLKPIILTPKAIYAYVIVMNKSKAVYIKNKIFLDLIKYKGWKI